MKKTMKLLSLLFASALLVGCAVNNKSNEGGKSGASSEEDLYPTDHAHEFDSEWSHDLNSHWHSCTCTTGDDENPAKCPAISDKAAHTWDEGTITQEPAAYKEGLKKFTCTVCGAERFERVAGLAGGEAQGNFTFDDSALNTVKEIHTTNQKNYLALNKPYYTMNGTDLNGFSATGASSLKKASWAPNAITVSWNYSVPSGKTLSKFQLIFGQYEDLGDAYIIDGDTNNSISFTNAFLGDNYFKVVANFSDGSKEASPVKVFKVDTQAPRNLDVGNMPNCRDMGGRETYAGGKIRQGLIYRTSGSKFDNSTPSDAAAKSVLLNQLKVKTEINVANSTTNNVNLDGGKVVDAFMDYGATPYSNLARNAEKIKQVMNVLADRNNYPVFYHCRIGTDRTGITGVMIGGLLGIKFNEVIQDYGFSNFSPIDNQRYPGKTPDNNGDDIKKYIDEILSMPGTNFQESTYNALLSIGVPANTLDTIIDIMTEGNKADLKVENVGVGDYLSSNGKKGTNSDFSKPSVYHTIKEDEQVSYTSMFTAGEKDIVVYLGSTNSSSSEKLADHIQLLIDGEEQDDIVDRTLHRCGFGSTQQNGRTGYMFSILGTYDLSAGEHVITIQGLSSTTFDVGTIAVFDHNESAEYAEFVRQA